MTTQTVASYSAPHYSTFWHPLVITNITTNGSAIDIQQVYDSIDKRRLDIAIKLKSIVRDINESLDNHERDEITDNNSTNETNDDLLL